MILPWIIITFFLGGVLVWISQRWGPEWPRWLSLAVMFGHMGLLLALWMRHVREIELPGGGPWLLLYDRPWVPQWGISFSLGMDGISLLLIVLSTALGMVAVAASWDAIREQVGFFHFNLLFVLAAIAGIFLALDLLVFYVFWEVLLVPLYFLIAVWGYEQRRTYAAIKFFIFTQASGLLMLVAILGLYFIHGRATGAYSFGYRDLLGTPMPESTAWWLMLGFFVAFAVKLPVVPLHTWLPDAHSEAPTAGSVNLAGLVLKVGAYGMFRFLVPLFPKAASDFAPAAMTIGVIGVVYGALVAFGQTDLKRLVAYTSISHMGFVLLGIFAWNQLALEGALVIMLAHGISTGALFVLVGDLYERIHTRDLDRMGGLWAELPRMGGVGLFFALASLGLPGLGNFVGEFLVLLGVYRVNTGLAVLATLGFMVSTVYSLWMVHRVFHGAPAEAGREGWRLFDMTGRETAIMAALITIIVWLGLVPQTVLSTGRRAFEDLQRLSGRPPVAAAPAHDLQVPGTPLAEAGAAPAPGGDHR